MSQIHRRRMHFGEVEPVPEDPDEYVMHLPMLRALLDGTYEWEK